MSALQPCATMLLPTFQLLSIDASTRRSRVATGGERHDSGRMSIKLIILSRLLHTRDEPRLQTASMTGIGIAVSNALKRVVLAAVPSLTLQSVDILFNTVGATISRQTQYNALLSLPDRLPWPQARKLYSSLLDAATSTRALPIGATIEALLSGDSTHDEAQVAPSIDAFERVMAEQLEHHAEDDSSSSHSTQTTVPAPPPTSPPIDPLKSFVDNVRRRVEGHLHRYLTESEVSSLTDGILEATSLLDDASAADRRTLASSAMWAAMSHPAVAQAWAATLESIRSTSGNLDALIESIITTCSNVASNSLAALVSTFDADDLPSPAAISSGASRGRPTTPSRGARVY